jgi:hypothetical protein
LSWNTSTFYENGTISVLGPSSSSGAWSAGTAGNWETAGNWVNSTQPTGAGQTATFGDSIGTGAATVTITAPETVGVLNFNGTMGGAYTVAGTNVLTLSTGTSAPALVSVTAGTQTINAPVSLTAGLNINTAAGSQLVIGGSVNGGTGALTVTTGSRVTLASTGTIGVPLVINGQMTFANASSGSSPLLRSVPSLNVSGTVSLALGNHPTRQLLSVGSVSIAPTGSIDLSNNDMVLVGGNAAGLTQLTNLVRQGYAGGTWQGVGGIVSSAAMNDTTHLTTLGVVLNTNTSGGTTTNALFNSVDGTTTNPGDVLVKYTYYGDTNLDGHIDGTDYSRIDNGVNMNLTGWYNGDFNYDGVINGSDYTLIDNAYNTQGASLADQIASPSAEPTAQIGSPTGVSAVPEPTSLGLLALGAVGLLGRRRRV